MKLYLILLFIFTSFISIGQVSKKVSSYSIVEKTGNISIDEANQIDAKYQWIKNNPEEYRALGGNPDEFITKSDTGNNAISNSFLYPSPINIDNSTLFKLVSVEALDINTMHTKAEMAVFQKDAENELDRMNIIIDFEKQIWYYIPRNTKYKPRINQFIIDDNSILFTDCKKCEDNTFAIISKTSDILILQIKPQDEGQNFVYQIVLKK